MARWSHIAFSFAPQTPSPVGLSCISSGFDCSWNN